MRRAAQYALGFVLGYYATIAIDVTIRIALYILLRQPVGGSTWTPTMWL